MKDGGLSILNNKKTKKKNEGGITDQKMHRISLKTIEF